MITFKTYINIKISYLCVIILIITSQSGFAQIFDSAQNPLSVKWRRIQTNGFSLLYPSELEKEAQRMAATISQIYPLVGQGLNLQKTRLPIVFQNRGTAANGFVQLAPKKSQFYTTPPQKFDSQDWLNNLAVHELRHVAQFDKLTGKQNLFLAEEIYFAMIGISTPTWFLEGDAVSTETALTNAGRGRQPAWIMPFRTSLLSGKKFSYSKSYFGSNKDQTPGYYQLGYLLTSQLRTAYGKTIINDLLGDINKRPFRLYPFSNSLKKFTTYRTQDFYKKTVDELTAAWRKQDQLQPHENYASLNRSAKYATNYWYPTAINADQILSLKASKGDASGFVRINPDKSEEELFKIGYQEEPWFSYGDKKLVWDEIRADPRYKQRSYSVICTYDFETKRKKQLTFKTRLFSPSLSADGKKLIAVQINLSNEANLVAIDLESGQITTTYPNPANEALQTPALNHNGKEMTWISVSEKGKALWFTDSTGTTTKIVSETNQQLGRPQFISNTIAFNTHLSGIDNIYSIDPQTKKISALTASKYGAFNASPTWDQQAILFNNYQLMGHEIAKTPIEPLPVQEDTFVYFGAAATAQENTGNVFSDISDTTYLSTKYNPLAHLFRFHSISPDIDADDRLGLQLKSNDLLNVFDFSAGLRYDGELKKMEYNMGMSFKSLYPVFTASLKNRPRTAFYRLNNQITQANWRENHLNLKASLPLSITAYNHNYSLLAEIATTYTKRDFEAREKKLLVSTIKFPMNYRIGFGHSVRTAERDIAPKWAQSFTLTYNNQPFDKKLTGELFAFESALYFPGLAKNHSFMASFNYQERSGVLVFSNEINTVYGYGQIKATSELRNTLLLNYRFPFAFPDAEIGALAYIRNLRGGFFSHYENIGSETNLSQPKTFGLELRSSMNLLRYQPIVDLGVRAIFVNKSYNQNPILEFMFNYSF